MGRIFSIPFILTLTWATIAQDPQKPVLLDEFPALPCDELLARTDALVADLAREPSSEAIILIYKPANNPEHATGRRKLISSDLSSLSASQSSTLCPGVNGPSRTLNRSRSAWCSNRHAS